jgi:hypothetical protein
VGEEKLGKMFDLGRILIKASPLRAEYWTTGGKNSCKKSCC